MVMEVDWKATQAIRQTSTRQKMRAIWRLRSRVPVKKEREGSIVGGW